MIGAFDRPDRVVPTQQFGTESRLGWVVAIANLPSRPRCKTTVRRSLAASSATSIRTMIRAFSSEVETGFALRKRVKSRS